MKKMFLLAVTAIVLSGTAVMAQTGTDQEKAFDNALNTVQAYLDKNLSEYTIADVTSLTAPGGRTVFSVSTTDNTGNRVLFRVGPAGRLAGPVAEERY